MILNDLSLISFPENVTWSARTSIAQTIQVQDEDRSSASPLRDREHHFVPSQNDSRWVSFAGTGVPAPPMPSAVTYPQNTVAHPQEYYYYPYPGTGQTMQQQQQQQIPSYSFMQYHNHHHSNSASYFFDIPDPSLDNFQLSQHVMSTSSSRTFLPDD